VVLPFLLLFVGLELCHPAADLLHRNSHCDGAEHNTADHGTTAAETQSIEAHDPLVLASAPRFQLPMPRRWVVPYSDPRPESPALFVPSPVPIRS
jgi:hypothetical protein